MELFFKQYNAFSILDISELVKLIFELTLEKFFKSLINSLVDAIPMCFLLMSSNFLKSKRAEDLFIPSKLNHEIASFVVKNSSLPWLQPNLVR